MNHYGGYFHLLNPPSVAWGMAMSRQDAWDAWDAWELDDTRRPNPVYETAQEAWWMDGIYMDMHTYIHTYTYIYMYIYIYIYIYMYT